MKEKRSKIVYLEILRIIAIFGVIFCHTQNSGVHHYVETTNPVNYWFGIFLASVVEYCVPLFFMVTGAVLLDREESIIYVYRHRVLRMVIVTVLASLGQYLWHFRDYWQEIGLKKFLRLLYEGSVSGNFWFLYAYLSLLMVLPFLQRLVKAISDDRWFLYLFVGWLLLNDLLTILENYLGWNHTSLELPILNGYVLTSIMGYYVEHRSGEIFLKKKNILILLGISVLLTLSSMFVNYSQISGPQYITMGHLFSSVYALIIFVTVRYMCYNRKMPKKLESILCFAGAGAFGTYLIEPQLRTWFYPVYETLAPRIHAYPAAFVWVTVCVLVGILLANLFKLIPVVGKLI